MKSPKKSAAFAENISEFSGGVMYGKFGIDDNVIAFASEVEKGLGERFAEIDKNAEYNALKVIKAMQDSCVSEACLHGTTGYGYNDIGREKLEEVYSRVFHTEAALVRPLISCGTHALSTALFAVLRPGDEMISITGKPYDTLEEVIGIRPSKGSLAEFGVTYKQVELTPEGTFDHEAIRNAISEKTKLVEIQRSKGYLNRPSLSVKEIGEAIKTVKSVRSDIICMVDNCYGEFVDTIEPSDVGADMCVGSLIKNPGGGLAPIGGYIAGTEEIVDLCGIRLTSPGLGREVGASLEVNSRLFQGLFMAPTVTASALKGAIFAANCYERLGYEVIPDGTEKRNDIIQAVTMKTPEALVAFCKGIQKAAPVDSYVDPEPDEMPGYDSKVIMAAGAFVQGSSIELSADGPLREPYSVYFQGGLTWPSAKLGIIMTIQQLKNEGIITV
jgi:cystathionine beta-lyase family protein involved in aluminum resistance